MSKAIIKTEKGDMTVEFYDADAPNTVANFKKLAASGFYNNVIFHRVNVQDNQGSVPGRNLHCGSALCG